MNEPMSDDPTPIPTSASGEPSRKRRRSWRVGALLALAALGVVGIVVATQKPSAPVRANSIGARLELASGDVFLLEGTQKTKLLSGSPLPTGARMATGKGARALVRTADGAKVFLRADSELTLGAQGVDVERGELWIDAPRSGGEANTFSVAAEGGKKHVITASDAGLDIRRDGAGVAVYVARGLAVLTSPGGRVEVNAGEEAKAGLSGKPTLAPVPFWQDWTGGMGDTRVLRGVGVGSGRIYGIEPWATEGTPAKKLGIAKQAVRATLRDGLAETEVDQTFSNPGGQAIEGYYWFTIPASATVTSFALETDGRLVEGEVTERKEAQARYEAAVRSAHDPALLEWVDGHSYRARIFPIPANGTRRVVLRYIEKLPVIEKKQRYVYPLRSDDELRFEEFSLSVDLGPDAKKFHTAASLDARVESDGRLVTMRRSGFAPRADFQLELEQTTAAPAVRAWRYAPGPEQADYVMLRYTPDVDFSKLGEAKGDVVVVVDTSADGDESARQLRVAAAETALRALADQDHFALVALDVVPRVLYPKDGLAAATDADISRALEKLSEHATGGATDLGAMFEPALERLHGTDQPAVVYVGDGMPTAGETSSEALVERLRRALTGSRARLFALGVGENAHHELLTELVRVGGGQYLRVDNAQDATERALRLASAIKTPTITDLDIDVGAGLDAPFVSATGKLTRGEEVVLLARTHHPLPDQVKIHGRVGGAEFVRQYPLRVEMGKANAFVPKLWASEYVHRLLGQGEEKRSQVLSLGLEYGLMTPFTSILALDSEQAYARYGIRRSTSPIRDVRLTSADFEFDALATPRVMAGCDSRSNTRHAPEEQSMRTPASKGERATAQVPEAEMRHADSVATAAATPPAPPASLGVGAAGAVSDRDLAKEVAPAPSAVGPDQRTQPRLDDGAGLARAPRRTDLTNPFDNKADVSGLREATGRRGPVGSALKPAEAPKSAPVVAPDPAKVAQIVARARPTRCSDAASRSLSERIALWERRMKKANGAIDLLRQYEMARGACELPDWRDQSALLDLVQQKVQTEEAARTVLTHFAHDTEAQVFLARRMLRRTSDARIVAEVSRVIFGGTDWAKVDRDLLDKTRPEDRMAVLRAALLGAKGDPRGEVRMVRLLSELGEKEQALAYGRRLRERGFLTPTLAAELGDLLARAGDQEEALRTYSEIVEFDGSNPAARKILGDIYLRQGWYAPAYRQFRNLVDMQPKDPEGWIRLARAAALSGRVDEALRIERDVASGEGTPGPNDPRYFARLWSAAHLATLMADPAQSANQAAMGRKLKELSLFSGAGTLALLVWNDLDTRLVLTPRDEKALLGGEPTDATNTGLFAILDSTSHWEQMGKAIQVKSDLPTRPVPFQLVTIAWDQKKFEVHIKTGDVAPRTNRVVL